MPRRRLGQTRRCSSAVGVKVWATVSQQADEPSTREMAQTLKQLGANSRWHLSGSSRVLQIVLIAHVRPLNSQIASASELLQAVFQSDAAAIEWSIGETIRQRAAAYFPAEYTIFVRVDLLDRGDSAGVVYDPAADAVLTHRRSDGRGWRHHALQLGAERSRRLSRYIPVEQR